MRSFRWWIRIVLMMLAGAVVLVAAAGAVWLFVMSLQPKPAPTTGGKAAGTITEADSSGMRTYESRSLHFRFRYPADWRLTESESIRSPEGDYLTIALLPKTSSTKGTLDPPLFEVAPDPQGFSAEAITRMKWGSRSTTLTVTTSTAEVAGKPAVEVYVSEAAKRGKRLYTYDLIATPGGRLFDLGFSSSDVAEFEALREQMRRLAATVQTY